MSIVPRTTLFRLLPADLRAKLITDYIVEIGDISTLTRLPEFNYLLLSAVQNITKINHIQDLSPFLNLVRLDFHLIVTISNIESLSNLIKLRYVTLELDIHRILAFDQMVAGFLNSHCFNLKLDHRYIFYRRSRYEEVQNFTNVVCSSRSGADDYAYNYRYIGRAFAGSNRTISILAKYHSKLYLCSDQWDASHLNNIRHLVMPDTSIRYYSHDQLEIIRRLIHLIDIDVNIESNMPLLFRRRLAIVNLVRHFLSEVIQGNDLERFIPAQKVDQIYDFYCSLFSVPVIPQTQELNLSSLERFKRISLPRIQCNNVDYLLSLTEPTILIEVNNEFNWLLRTYRDFSVNIRRILNGSRT